MGLRRLGGARTGMAQRRGRNLKRQRPLPLLQLLQIFVQEEARHERLGRCR
jgi:hypothetical protein